MQVSLIVSMIIMIAVSVEFKSVDAGILPVLSRQRRQLDDLVHIPEPEPRRQLVHIPNIDDDLIPFPKPAKKRRQHDGIWEPEPRRQLEDLKAEPRRQLGDLVHIPEPPQRRQIVHIPNNEDGWTHIPILPAKKRRQNIENLPMYTTEKP